MSLSSKTKSRATTSDNISPDVPVLKLDTRSKILKAAIMVFADIGYDAASLRQITALAGVNHGSIKYHYNGKEELWQACVIYLYAQLETTLVIPDVSQAKMSLRDSIERSMRLYIRFLAKHPELFKITMYETMKDSPRLEWLTKNITIPYTKQSLKLIRKAKKAGVYPDKIPTMNLFYLLVGASRYTYFIAPEASKVFGKDLTSDKEIKRHEDAVIQLFLGK